MKPHARSPRCSQPSWFAPAAVLAILLSAPALHAQEDEESGRPRVAASENRQARHLYDKALELMDSVSDHVERTADLALSRWLARARSA